MESCIDSSTFPQICRLSLPFREFSVMYVCNDQGLMYKKNNFYYNYHINYANYMCKNKMAAILSTKLFATL